MKIAYVANMRMPTERAHGLQVAKTVEALARNGADVRLIVPRRKNDISESLFTYYGIPQTFPVTYVPVLDVVGWGRIGFLLESLSFAWSARACLAKDDDCLYGRDEFVLWFLAGSGIPLVWETHTGSWNVAARYLAVHARRIITISSGLKRLYEERGVSERKLSVAHDAVDITDYVQSITRDEARTRLGLPRGERIALYVGRLDGWKGAETLCETADLLKGEVQVVLVGGEPDQVDFFRKRYPLVRFVGARPYRELAGHLSAGDVLVLPNTARSIVSERYTSPLKLFAYMAADRPIVASELPSIREILSEEDAYFVQADDPDALAAGIRMALTDPNASLRAHNAHQKVTAYTWDARAKNLLASLMSSD